ncbi:C39 family peptidase [Acidobacteriota bacterium]
MALWRKERMRRSFLFSVSLVLLWITCIVFSNCSRSKETGISPLAQSSVEKFFIADSPLFEQTDPRWRNKRIGGSNEKVGSVGCTLCCVSMALVYQGLDSDPSKLNSALIQKNGYTKRGLLKWRVVEDITNNKIRIQIPTQPSHERINQALANDSPVVAKVRLRFGVQHWVLIVGRSGKEYLIQDPLGRGITLENLSKYGSNILAIRIVGV